MQNTEQSTEPKYPEIEVQLTGRDGNAFNIMGIVAKALRRAGHAAEVEAYMAESMSGDYNNVIATAMRWVQVA